MKIQSCIIPRISPILAIPKEVDDSGKQKWRIVFDFGKLIDVMVGDSFPISVI
jgi:hypothetical protein